MAERVDRVGDVGRGALCEETVLLQLKFVGFFLLGRELFEIKVILPAIGDSCKVKALWHASVSLSRGGALSPGGFLLGGLLLGLLGLLVQVVEQLGDFLLRCLLTLEPVVTCDLIHI